jgi:hypothetical protein
MRKRYMYFFFFRDVKIDVPDKYGFSPLMQASVKGYERSVDNDKLSPEFRIFWVFHANLGVQTNIYSYSFKNKCITSG